MTVVAGSSRTELRALADIDDDTLAARFLYGVPSNEGRSAETIARLARRAGRFGADLAARATDRHHDELTVVERSGGLAAGTVARYETRSHRVEIFTDTVAFCEELIDALGWREFFPAGCVRAAAVEHERAHHLVHADRSRDLRAALDHQVLRIGRFRRLGFVAGADEIAAHAYAARVLRLGRSPLLIATAAAAALTKEN